ncbi:ZYRO0D10472p [Zygosaccharomyces rouxii]|uniref:non-specific serine/threonine protein kinase n=1 Tax=Zygosaccharomyces rouxii (strain ATCC 2623 / CBS 732 / NBRC 1130 / NCYC 568 / NRRL Y-229) TaxID=559307 RepID=C5DVY8_ZYGRC|nr:uncharacterized protein ZYRO0D10472g [Zygosaccharomyces rouxii]KAH9200866.1 hypothetical protein LQ764DRAFT_100778 [Zygosaccharomyces rouxii]CAR27957.1 ZYRO0D10472p [Zygosaccharomyces rouxii]
MRLLQRALFVILWINLCLGLDLWPQWASGKLIRDESQGTEAASPRVTNVEYYTTIPTALRRKGARQDKVAGSTLPTGTPVRWNQTPTLISHNGSLKNDLKYVSGGKSALIPRQHERALEKVSLAGILLATDVEGGLHALNRDNGQLLWSIDSSHTKPLIHVVEPPRAQTKETLIIEPYGEGNIYYFNVYQGLQKLPVSIAKLIASSPMHLKTDIVVDDFGTVVEDEKIYTGSRSTAMYVIDATKGDILSAFGPGTENKKYKKDSDICATRGLEPEGCKNVLVIGKTTYHLGIHSRDGTTYNVTYSSWQQNTLDTPLSSLSSLTGDNTYIASFRDRSLLAINADFKIAKWVSSNFPGIINSIFDIFTDENAGENIIIPHRFTSPDEASFPRGKVFLSQIENDSWFALSGENYPSLVEAAPTAKYGLSERWRAPSLFYNEDLFATAVTGVHTLQNRKFEEISDMSTSRKPLISVQEREPLLLEPSTSNLPLGLEDDSTSRNMALETYISPEELEAYRLKVQEQIAHEIIQQNQGSFIYLMGRLIYRVIESGLVFLFALFVLAFLQRFKVIPPLHILFEKSGLISVEDIKVDNLEINDEMSNEKRPTANNGTGDSEETLKISRESTPSTTDNPNSPTDDEEETALKVEDEVTLKGGEEGTTIVEKEKKKRKRGTRGGKKLKKKQSSSSQAVEQIRAIGTIQLENGLKTLTVSEKILGYGSSGTVVLQGSFQGRPVAVKRMLLDFCDIASQEIDLLTESDDHPNVVRYFCSETTEKFLYIALELCNLTLEELIELKKPSEGFQATLKTWDPINILYQIASGVSHLHSLKIIHRDIKPQNILVASPKKVIAAGYKADNNGNLRILISDFGLCKKLEADQSSFRTSLSNAGGTSGWRAPELLHESTRKLIESMSVYDKDNDEDNESATNSIYDPATKQSLTKGIDIFSMGCVFYYILSKGGHPFGSRYIREANILKNNYDLSGLNQTLKDRSLVFEAKDLIAQMIQMNPLKRPSALRVLNHPLFWSNSKKLEFLLKVSDRFEVERRDPPSELLCKLESHSNQVIPNNDWTSKFDKDFMDNLGKYRKYSGEKLMDLLRALRNKYHHFMDLPEDLAAVIGPVPDGFYNYFIKRFPNLLLEIYHVVQENLKDDQILCNFIE